MIQSGWYKVRSVCARQNNCATCRAANDQGLLNPKPTKTTFIHDGFTNWKKALKMFREHQRSNMHKDATIKLQQRLEELGLMPS